MYDDIIIRKHDKAEALYGEALELDQWYRPAFENQINMYRKLRRFKDALKMFERYPHFDAIYPAIRLLKASVLVENGAIEQGLSEFAAGIVFVTGDLTFFEDFIAALDKGDHRDAIQKVIALLQQHGYENPDALVMLARFECDNKRFPAAAELVDRALALEPENIPASVQKARTLHGLGRKSEAFEIFEANRLKDKDGVDNNYYFSRILATDGIDLDRATNIARETFFDAMGDLAVWMNLAYTYYQAGRYDLARGEAMKASSTFPEAPEPPFWVGMAMFMEGKDGARDKLQEAIRLGLKGDQLERAQETLAKM